MDYLRLKMNNIFISQLEEEIKKEFPISYVLETKEHALNLNQYNQDNTKQLEDKNYINTIVSRYIKENERKNNF